MKIKLMELGLAAPSRVCEAQRSLQSAVQWEHTAHSQERGQGSAAAQELAVRRKLLQSHPQPLRDHASFWWSF